MAKAIFFFFVKVSGDNHSAKSPPFAESWHPLVWMHNRSKCFKYGTQSFILLTMTSNVISAIATYVYSFHTAVYRIASLFQIMLSTFFLLFSAYCTP